VEDPVPVLMYMNEDEIVAHLLRYNLTKTDKDLLRGKPAEELCKLDDTFGQWIRTTYRMWESNNPFYDPSTAKDGTLRIIEKVWCVLTGQSIIRPVVEAKAEEKEYTYVYQHPDYCC